MFPSLVPTMFPSLVPTLLSSTVPTVVPSDSPTSKPSIVPTVSERDKVCISFILANTFGDGRGCSGLYVFDECGYYSVVKSSCGVMYAATEYCFDPLVAEDGDTVSGTVFGYNTMFPWETLWMAVIKDTGTVYTGSFMTTMQFSYHPNWDAFGRLRPQIRLESSDNLLSNSVYCTACVKGYDKASYGSDNKRNQPYNDDEDYSNDYSNSKSTSRRSRKYRRSRTGGNSGYRQRSSSDDESVPEASSPQGTDESLPRVSVSVPGRENHEDGSHSSQNLPDNSPGILDQQHPRDNKEMRLRSSPGRKSIARALVEHINEYLLYGENAFSWYTTDRRSSYFRISDCEGRELYYTGTLCEGVLSHAPCDLSQLSEGTYLWRANGFLDPNKESTSYSFCGVRGSFSTELQFEVDNHGNCVPLRFRTLDDVCSAQNMTSATDSVQTSVSLLGSIILEGKRGDDLTAEDIHVIRTTLAQEFSEASVRGPIEETIEVLSWESIPSSHTVGRKLEDTSLESRATHQIDFRATVISEHFGVDGTDEENLDSFADDLSVYLHHSMVSGLFTSKLVSNAVRGGVMGLQSVRQARLERFAVSRRDESLSISSSGFIISLGILLGILTGVLILFLRQPSLEGKGHGTGIVYKKTANSTVEMIKCVPHTSLRPKTQHDVNSDLI
mmetsp:Transcript_14450/g.14547  ORF Transcript_14450/g.14547 Transcript_14450/m.14547 type:complete len:669 (+) Transcript_14450:1-2007(+)